MSTGKADEKDDQTSPVLFILFRTNNQQFTYFYSLACNILYDSLFYPVLQLHAYNLSVGLANIYSNILVKCLTTTSESAGKFRSLKVETQSYGVGRKGGRASIHNAAITASTHEPPDSRRHCSN